MENVVDTGWLAPGLVSDKGEGTIYAVFNPEQIKSATGNTGAFSATSGNILYQGAQDGRTGSNLRGGAGSGAAQQDIRTTVSGEPAADGWAGATRISRGGSPITVYRGASRTLGAADFGLDALGKASGNPSSGLGVWFTTGK